MLTWLVTCTPSSSVMPPLASMKLKGPMKTWSPSVSRSSCSMQRGRRDAGVRQRPALRALAEDHAIEQRAHDAPTQTVEPGAHHGLAAAVSTGQVARRQKYAPKYSAIASDTAQPAPRSPSQARPPASAARKSTCPNKRQLQGPGLRVPGHRHHRQRRGNEVQADVQRQRARQFAGIAPRRRRRPTRRPTVRRPTAAAPAVPPARPAPPSRGARRAARLARPCAASRGYSACDTAPPTRVAGAFR